MATKVLKKNPRFTGLISVLLILIVGAFLRLYRISDYMTFLGDEGRDVLVVKHILEGKLTLLGPTASVGGFFLGPIYYYFMVPFLWLFRLDPVGPAVMVGLFGIATVFFVYWAGREFFGHKAGFFAASLYAISPLVIAYSRSSWNPNLMPFFSLITLFTLYLGVKHSSWKYFLISGIFLGVAMQLHYLATFLAVIIAVYLFLRLHLRQGVTLTSTLINYSQIFLGFLIGFSPFLAFEVRHGFPNTGTIFRFMFGGTGETGFVGEKLTTIIGDVFFRLFARLVTRFPPPEQVSLKAHLDIAVWYYLTMLLAVVSVTLLLWQGYQLFKKHSSDFPKYLLLGLWFVFGVGLFAFYKKPIYDYYFGFMFTLPFLLVGNFLSFLWQQKYIFKSLSLLIFLVLIFNNLQGAPFRYPPNKQKEQVKAISQFVLEKTEGQPFNFALLTLGNSDHAYRYFFELVGNPPVTIENTVNDPERKTVTDQLLIICEDPNCQPLGHPLWEVAGFGRAEIVGEWQIPFVKVYKLVHYSGSY